MTLRMSARLPFRSRHMAVSCSLRFRYGRSWKWKLDYRTELEEVIFVLNDIGTDWRAEDSRQRQGLAAAGAIGTNNANSRTVRHFDCVEELWLVR